MLCATLSVLAIQKMTTLQSRELLDKALKEIQEGPYHKSISLPGIQQVAYTVHLAVVQGSHC